MPTLLTGEVVGTKGASVELNRLGVQERQSFLTSHCHQLGPDWFLRPEAPQVAGGHPLWMGRGCDGRGQGPGGTEIPGIFRW